MANPKEKTLLLTREDVARLLTLPELIEELRNAYRLRSEAGETVRPPLGRAIEQSRAAGRIAVVALETLEAADRRTGAIERAIAGGA